MSQRRIKCIEKKTRTIIKGHQLLKVKRSWKRRRKIINSIIDLSYWCYMGGADIGAIIGIIGGPPGMLIRGILVAFIGGLTTGLISILL